MLCGNNVHFCFCEKKSWHLLRARDGSVVLTQAFLARNLGTTSCTDLLFVITTLSNAGNVVTSRFITRRTPTISPINFFKDVNS